ADVLGGSLVPRAHVFDSKPNWNVQLQSPRARNPRWLATGFPANRRRDFAFRFLYPGSAPHGLPVILILCGTQQADLIVVAIRSTPRPRKFVRAPTQHENIQEFLRHGYVTPALPDASIIGPVARLEQVTFVYCSLIRRM